MSETAAQQECPEGGRHEPMHDDEGVSCRWCRTPMKLPDTAACKAPTRCTCGCWATLGLGRGVVCGARRNGLTVTTCVRLLAHDDKHRGFGADSKVVRW